MIYFSTTHKDEFPNNIEMDVGYSNINWGGGGDDLQLNYGEVNMNYRDPCYNKI